MFKFFLIIVLVFDVLFIPTIVFAKESIFKARVLKIIEQKKNILSDGTEAYQQKIKLKGLDGEYKNKEIIFNGIDDFDVLNKNIYKNGDKVLVVASSNDLDYIFY